MPPLQGPAGQTLPSVNHSVKVGSDSSSIHLAMDDVSLSEYWDEKICYFQLHTTASAVDLGEMSAAIARKLSPPHSQSTQAAVPQTPLYSRHPVLDEDPCISSIEPEHEEEEEEKPLSHISEQEASSDNSQRKHFVVLRAPPLQEIGEHWTKPPSHDDDDDNRDVATFHSDFLGCNLTLTTTKEERQSANISSQPVSEQVHHPPRSNSEHEVATSNNHSKSAIRQRLSSISVPQQKLGAPPAQVDDNPYRRRRHRSSDGPS